MNEKQVHLHNNKLHSSPVLTSLMFVIESAKKTKKQFCPTDLKFTDIIAYNDMNHKASVHVHHVCVCV